MELLYNYCHLWHKSNQKGGNFENLNFFKMFFCMDYWWAIENIVILFWKGVLKGTQILKFYIFKRYIKFYFSYDFDILMHWQELQLVFLLISVSVMVFELTLIPVKLVQEEVLVDLLCSYAAHDIFFLHFLTKIIAFLCVHKSITMPFWRFHL